MVYIFFLVFFVVFSLVNYYFISRIYYATGFLPLQVRRALVVILIIAASAYPLSKIVYHAILPLPLYGMMVTIGAFWFAFLLYGGLYVVAVDLIRLFARKSLRQRLSEKSYSQLKLAILAGGLVFTFGVVLYGYLQARDYQIVRQEVQIESAVEDTLRYQAVFLSDIHLSTVSDVKSIRHLVTMVNQLDADFILIGGDLVDDTQEVLETLGFQSLMQQMKARAGKYAIMGNHEYIVGEETAIDFIKKSGFTLLRDTAILVDSAFYLIGRDDPTRMREMGVPRKDLYQITGGLDSGFARIVLDHQPSKLDSAIAHKTALQLSGHTHNGQMYPGSIVTNWIYELSYGYGRFGDMQLYVSSGAGGWGPPVKVGSVAEIVLLDVVVVPGRDTKNK